MKNLFSVEGKVVVVTGGSRGIGEMIATGFVHHGARVYVTSRKAEACERVARELSKLGDCIALPFDLSGRDGIQGLVAALGDREARLDVLVNNAGASWGADLDDFPESGWDKVLTLNLKSPFFLTQKLLPLLRAAATWEEPARVINISSIESIWVPGHETYAYSASKAAVHHLTRVLARKLAERRITVNAIAPGYFDTEMSRQGLDVPETRERILKRIPMRRVGEPSELAPLVVYMASEASAYMTGEVVKFDLITILEKFFCSHIQDIGTRVANFIHAMPKSHSLTDTLHPLWRKFVVVLRVV